LKISFFFF